MVQEMPQRIAQLTPLDEACAIIEAQAKATEPRDTDLGAAHGRTLAQDVAIASDRPAKPLALRDGWALHSELTNDAGPYAPALLPAPPAWRNAGEELPDGADAIAPLDAVLVRNGRAEVIAVVAPGEGVLPAGAEASAAQPLRRAGERLRAVDAAILAGLGITTVRIREPRIRVVRASRASPEMIGAAVALIVAAITAAGGVAITHDDAQMPDGFKAALRHEGADAVIAIGGTGSGRDDRSIVALAQAGKLAFHGIGLMPGETSAFGLVGTRPVLLLPGRMDAALAAWLVIGQRLLARLCGRSHDEAHATAILSRKVPSTVGIAQVIPVRRDGDKVEPLAGEYWPLQALARADGWIFVPADSEGYPAGAIVSVRALP
jgi:molybdopterin molybdotransferase